MAKKEETISLIDTFSEFKELKNIDRTTMVSVLEESFRSVIAKMFGTDENYDVIVNPDKGDFEIWRNREVVADEDLTNPNMQISLTEAQKIDASYEVGEEVTDEVIFAKFGRRAILNLRQTLASKILELEKDSLYNKYIDRVGTVISAEVYQIWKKEMLLLDDEGNELLLPKTEQIPSDFYRKGETARAVVARVDNKNNNPKIILSRTSPVFLQRLFEMEVPEINDGLITIKKIARIPGERAKIAVESYDDRIDPVGACVGVKGSRIHGIVRELRNENIDVINYTSNIQLFIQRALSPAKISSIVLHEEEKKAEVYLKPEEVSLAIGKGGMNIKLASMLTEYTIDVYRELDESAMDEDIYLDEFKDEIDEWVITAIKNIGLERLQRMTSPFILRRMKENVLRDLPEKLEENRYVKFESRQQKLYDAQVVHMKQKVVMQDAQEFQRNKIQILAELMKLRQICCDPGLCFENYNGESAKLDACVDLVRSAAEGGHKILLFSQFTSMLDLIAKRLEEEKMSFYTITGATPKEKRLQLVKTFNRDDTKVFLISLKAGGVGLNLTGADVVIHYDPWWNLAVQNQATDRTHRIGQTKMVVVYRLIAKGTIEEKIQELQESKRALSEQIIQGDAGQLGGMSREDFIALLS